MSTGYPILHSVATGSGDGAVDAWSSEFDGAQELLASIAVGRRFGR